jgi:exodeoxyribonuclease VII large subunit
MPFLPQRVGVITSASGAAIHDILNILKRRFASLQVLIYPVRVQGEGAALEIARAIDDMNSLALVDVLIVGRGGGSLEDLWAFNEEPVARAVYRSKIPVISAVGHETDWTICDFVADLRAPTPSAAAELVIASAGQLRQQLDALDHRLQLAIENRLATLQAGVETLRRLLQDPGTMLGHMAQRVDDLAERLDNSLENLVDRRRERFLRLENGLLQNSPMARAEQMRQQVDKLTMQSERLLQIKLEGLKGIFVSNAARLDVLSPLSTLSRGYAIALKQPDNRVVTDVLDIEHGDRLDVRLHKGSVICLVEKIEGGCS